jgi:hypothetical protein
MLIVAIKLKAGVDAHRLDSFIQKLVPELQRSTRIGSLTSLKLYSSAHTGVRLDEFVLTIDGFMQEPPLTGLEELCDVVYSFECEETGSWPKGSGKH